MHLQRRLKVSPPPVAQPAEPSVRVAFASSDLRHVDRHFGIAESFAVHAVAAHGHTLLEALHFAADRMDGNDGKLTAKIAALEGCVAVYCVAVGASAIARLRAQGIQPIPVAVGAPIKRLLAELQQELRLGPSAWLQRAIIRQQAHDADDDRFAAMESEGWNE